MKPQAIGSQQFFLELCRELGLSPTDSDEETILWAVAKVVRRSANLSEMSKDAKGVWEALPSGTELPPTVIDLMKDLIMS